MKRGVLAVLLVLTGCAGQLDEFITPQGLDARIVLDDSLSASERKAIVGFFQNATAAAFVEREGLGQRWGTLMAYGDDVVEFGSPADEVEVGENIGVVRNAFTERDLDALTSGLDLGSHLTEYNQFLRFNTSGGTVDAGGVFVGLDLAFFRNDVLFEYLLEFEEGFESKVRGGRLFELEDEIINIIGNDYVVSEARLRGEVITLDLLRGDRYIILGDNDEVTVELEGTNYTIEALAISEQQDAAKLRINGQITPELERNEIADLEDGTFIAVHDITTTGKDVQKSVLELFLSSLRITLTDLNISDDNVTGSGAEFNSDSVSESFVQVKGRINSSTNSTDIQHIKYRLELKDTPFEEKCADYDITVDAICLEKGDALSEFLGEPIKMLSGWDVYFGGVDEVVRYPINIYAPTDDSYRFAFYSNNNVSYDFPLIDNSNQDGLGFKFGDEDDDFVFIEAPNRSACNIDLDDMFLVTVPFANTTGRSHVMRYENFDSSNKVLQFKEVLGGPPSVGYMETSKVKAKNIRSTKETTFQGTPGVDASGELEASGGLFSVSVCANGSLAIDQNRDNRVNGGKALLTTAGGALWDFGRTNTPNGSFNISMIAAAKKVSGRTAGEDLIVNITLFNESQFGDAREVDLAVFGARKMTPDADVVPGGRGLRYFQHEYIGVFAIPNDDKANRELEVAWPQVQPRARVFVGAGDVFWRKVREPPRVANQVVNASDVKELSGTVIVIGDPCAGEMQRLLGVDDASCQAERKVVEREVENGRALIVPVREGQNVLELLKAS